MIYSEAGLRFLYLVTKPTGLGLSLDQFGSVVCSHILPPVFQCGKIDWSTRDHDPIAILT